ncbi:hypothetical protein [Sphingomonas sp.]|uniref:hypothetical protein n=1 Tax=Sphingomonas sp. TaxID=28214 RepID=UPI003B3B6B24
MAIFGRTIPNRIAGGRRLLCCTLACAVAPAALSVPTSSVVAAPAAGCRVQPPVDVEKGVTTWLGPCRNGVAEGLGVVRIQHQLDWSLFLGRVAGGKPVTGALYLTPQNLVAATRFDSAGHVVSGDNPAADHQAFLLGAAVAKQAAVHFTAEKNARSAAFYARIAASLPKATSATGYLAGTVAAHTAALARLRAALTQGGKLDGRPITAVLPSGHCGTVIAWAGGSHRIDWTVQNDGEYIDGPDVRIAVHDNGGPQRMLSFPRRVTPAVKQARGAFLWACAPE